MQPKLPLPFGTVYYTFEQPAKKVLVHMFTVNHHGLAMLSNKVLVYFLWILTIINRK